MITINLTYLGNETLAEVMTDDGSYMVQTGRNGAEAASKMLALLKNHYKPGTEYEIPDHGMKGKL